MLCYHLPEGNRVSKLWFRWLGSHIRFVMQYHCQLSNINFNLFLCSVLSFFVNLMPQETPENTKKIKILLESHSSSTQAMGIATLYNYIIQNEKIICLKRQIHGHYSFIYLFFSESFRKGIYLRTDPVGSFTSRAAGFDFHVVRLKYTYEACKTYRRSY